MRTAFLLSAALLAGAAPATPQTPAPPPGAVKYAPGKYTQAISVNRGLDGIDRDVIERVPVAKLEEKWRVPGGMEGIPDVSSVKYRTLPEGEGVRYAVKPVEIVNGIKYVDRDGVEREYTQFNKAVVREYPDGTRFDEVLYYKGRAFEHRVRVKEGGRWRSSVAFRDKAARPPGYAGLTVTCASCHNLAGSGGYNAGLIPGGDGVFSDPIDFSPWDEIRRTGRDRH